MATIYDIAKASGVSATTVSHVLNRTRYVSPEVTSRVMDAVEELGYEPLRQRNKSNDMSQVKRGCMGLIIDRQLLTVCGCRSYVRMSGQYEWITISVDGTLTEKQLMRYMKQYHLNRVLVHQSVEYQCAEQPIRPVELGSILLLNQHISPERTDQRHLTLDYENAVRLALEHLIRCGHTNITILGGNLNHCCYEQIIRALEWCSKHYSVRLNQDNVVWFNGDQYTETLEPGSIGTAVLSVGAPGIMAVTNYCFTSGSRIPEDFSWVAIDDDDFIQGYNPTVTYVRLDPEAFRSVLEHGDDPEKRIICTPELVIRHSTCVMPRDPHEQPASREGAVSLTITEKILMQKRSGRVGVSFAQAETLYSQMILQGIKEVAANLNLDLLPVQDARLNSEVEKNQLVWLLQNGADAIISVSNDHTDMTDTFHRLRRSSDIPLVLGSHLPINLLGTMYHSCITTNDGEKGRQAAQFLAEQMLSRQMQRLVLLVDKNTATGAQQCVRALITALHGDYPRIQVLEQVFINDHYSAEDFEKLYLRYPEMQGLFIQNAGAAARISEWLHANSRDDVVIVTSQINSSVAQRMMQVTSGRMGIVSSRPIEMGHLMVYSAACALMGKPTPKYVSVDPVTLNQKNVEGLWSMLTQSRLK